MTWRRADGWYATHMARWQNNSVPLSGLTLSTNTDGRIQIDLFFTLMFRAIGPFEGGTYQCILENKVVARYKVIGLF